MKTNIKVKYGILGGILALMMFVICLLILSPTTNPVSAATINDSHFGKIVSSTCLKYKNYNGEPSLYLGDIVESEADEIFGGTYNLNRLNIQMVIEGEWYTDENGQDYCEYILNVTKDCMPYYSAAKGYCVPLSYFCDFSIMGDYIITSDPYYESENGGTNLCSGMVTFTYSISSIPLPQDPIKEGYTFIGWFFDSNFIKPYDGSPIYEDTILYASFKINTYIVTFDSVGGSDIEKETVNWNTSLSSLSNPTKTGYTFMGWHYADETIYDNEPIKTNITLYAKWEQKIYVVTFIVDDEVYKTVNVPYGTNLSAVIATAQMSDYLLKTLKSDSGAVLDGDFNDLAVMDNLTLTVNPLDTSQKAVALGKKYWYVGVISLIGLAFLISAPFGKKKKKVR